MRHSVIIFIIFLITIIGSCERIFEGDTTQVYGKITDIETDEPLSNVKIYLYEGWSSSLFNNGGLRITDSIFTDESGEYDLEFSHNDKYNYTIKPIVPYYVYFNKDGKAYSESLWEGRLQKQNFKMSRYGNTTIEGIITDKETDEVLENVRVTITTYQDTSSILDEAFTDKDGNYKLVFFQENYFEEYIIELTQQGYFFYGRNPETVPDKTTIVNIKMGKL